jgi:acyl carrier protein
MSKIKDIVAILHEVTDIELGEIGEHSMLFDEGIIDSLAILDLLTSIENKYEIKISSEHLNAETFASPSTIADLVERYKR